MTTSEAAYRLRTIRMRLEALEERDAGLLAMYLRELETIDKALWQVEELTVPSCEYGG